MASASAHSTQLPALLLTTLMLAACSRGAEDSAPIDADQEAPTGKQPPVTHVTNRECPEVPDAEEPPALCTRHGWCLVRDDLAAIAPWAGQTLVDALAHGSNEAYAVGVRGTILRFDGERWTRERCPVTEDVIALSRGGQEAPLALTAKGTLLKRQQGTWDKSGRLPPLPTPAGEEGGLSSGRVWLFGPEDVWVGLGGPLPQRLRHWDGDAWRAVPLPDNPRRIDWVFSSPEEVVVGAGLRSFAAAVYRKSGSPGGADAGADDLADGGTDGGTGFEPSWQREVYDRDRCDHACSAGDRGILLACRSGMYRLAEGKRTALHQDKSLAFNFALRMGETPCGVARYTGPTSRHIRLYCSDGEQWRHRGDLFGERPSSKLSFGLDDRALLIGGTGIGQRNWASVSAEDGLHSPPLFQDFWGRGEEDIYLVGAQGSILHFDGEAWRPEASGVDRFLSGVWGTADGKQVFAIGGDLLLRRREGAGGGEGAEGGEGGRWGPGLEMPLTTPNSIGGTGPDAVYLGNGRVAPVETSDGRKLFRSLQEGSTERFDGRKLVPVKGLEQVIASDIWASDARQVYAVDLRSILNIATGTRVLVPGRHPIAGKLWGRSANEIYVQDGYNRRVHRFDGTEFIRTIAFHDSPGPNHDRLQALHGNAGTIAVVTYHGRSFIKTGNSWCRAETGARSELAAVWVTPNGDIWAAGGAGTLLRRRAAAE